MKGVMRFGKKGKLSPRYVGPYRILKRIGKMAYELELPADLATVHPVFHISLLKKCVGDPASIVPLESVALKDSLSYEDVPVEILDRQVRRLRNKEVTSVKVLWRSQSVEGATWEAEAAMKSNVFACSWNSVQSEIQFSAFSGGTHGDHPRTVDGLTVRPAERTVIRSTVRRSDRRSKVQVLSIQITLRLVPGLQFSRISCDDPWTLDRRTVDCPTARPGYSWSMVKEFGQCTTPPSTAVDPPIGRSLDRGSLP
ncbi:hypothetical protein MTR67_002684 [Solanum verrucosum]|uniref:Tf2-1-like SH3-like domain-containing protein n=1 Tax=Solanum verrucosum TaxID=315347 RepID=A0AAF0PQM5_SOLVR|nr:hypothetical protein MTR67_002684 [Solanum verrucosum]